MREIYKEVTEGMRREETKQSKVKTSNKTKAKDFASQTAIMRKEPVLACKGLSFLRKLQSLSKSSLC